MNSEEIDFKNAEMLRIIAEQKLKEKHQKKLILGGEADLKKLLHELQVHQIELEMQNEELTLAYQAAEAALKKHTLLFELSPMGYFTLDESGIIYDLNFTGAEMLGERRFSLISSNFKLFISEDSQHIFDGFIKKIYANKAKESCKISLGYVDKSTCAVYIEGVVTEDDHNCFISVLDISRLHL